MAHRGCHATLSGVQDFSHPAIDDALAVLARPFIVDLDDLGLLEHRSEIGDSGATLGLAGRKLILAGASSDCMSGLVAQSISFLAAAPFLLPLTSAMHSAADRFPPWERNLHVVALLAGEQRVDDEEDAAAGLSKADRHRAAAAALGVGLNILAQLLHVGEGGSSLRLLTCRIEKSASPRCRTCGRPPFAACPCRRVRADRPMTPGGLRLCSCRNLLLVMNTSGSSAIAVHIPCALLKRFGRSAARAACRPRNPSILAWR